MVQYMAPDLDAVFGALADPTRRAVLADLRSGERTVGVLAAPFPMSLTGFIKHLGILEDAGLIERRKEGRVVSVRLATGGMKGAFEWLRDYEQFWSSRLDRLERYLERKDTAWPSPSTTKPASRSGAASRRRSPPSTRRGRTRKA